MFQISPALEAEPVLVDGVFSFGAIRSGFVI